MYCDEAIKLIRELKRYQDTLPPHNTDLVRSIQREIRHLYAETEQFMSEHAPQDDSSPPEISLSDNAFIAAITMAISRNKRCLIAYHHHRMQHLIRMVWERRAEGAGLLPPPAHIKPNLSAAEHVFYKQYTALVHRYKSQFADVLDVTSSLVPPRSALIHIRAARDLRFITESGEEKVLYKGQMEFVYRSDVEKFIEQGYLVHV